MNIQGLYQKALERLRDAGIPDAAIDAGILLSHVLGCSRAELFVVKRVFSPAFVEQFERVVRRRLAREPVAYILGEQEFWSLPFVVSPYVLIPRPETEHVVEAVLAVQAAGDLKNGPVLDLGTGSGILAVCLALELPDREVIAIDRSWQALLVAATNSRRHGVSGRVHCVNASWLDSLRAEPRFSVIVSNPPYVVPETISALQPEVRDFEPRLALDGGVQGVREIDKICRDLNKVLMAGGWFFMEIGADQEEYVLALFNSMQNYDSIRVIRDYAGLPRVLEARRIE